jgi:hypothetical protein
MPWQHVIIGSRCSWLHGDVRGFRNRGHRIHSSGDYKHRPPVSEHKGLREYHQRRSGKPVNFGTDVRITILREFVVKMREIRRPIIAASIGARHLHALTDLPDDYPQMKRIIGRCKQNASYRVTDILPGLIWSSGAEFKRVKDRDHLHNAYEYIRTKQERGTVVWSHRDDENWIDNREVGIVVMGLNRKHLRVFIGRDAGV